MSLEEQIRAAAGTCHRPDGSAYRSLPFAEQLRLAGQAGSSHQIVQMAALEMDIVPEVYARNQTSLSCKQQIELLRARVAIVGLGGLGGAVCELLARIGIGRLILIDGDRFADSNLNRQLLSSTETLGQCKAEVAVRRVAQVNPAVICRPVTEFLTGDNGTDLLAGAAVAVDCLDSIPARLLLQDLCKVLGIVLVSAAIGGASGQATVVLPGDEGLYRVYRGNESTGAGAEGRLGTLPFTAMAMAAVECAEVVAVALGRPAALRNRLLVTDLDDHSTMVIDLPGRSATADP